MDQPTTSIKHEAPTLEESDHPTKMARTESPVLIPPNACDSLRASIQKYGLQPPFSRVEDDKFWGDYFLERSLLDFRHENAFDSKGKELPTKKASRNMEFPDMVQEAWKKIVTESPVIPNDKVELPGMIPPCRESYAEYGSHPSKTARGEYLDFCQIIQTQVTQTLKKTSLPAGIKNTIGGQVYILEYWVNWEDGDVARTVDVKARLYSPIGNGSSVDLKWYRHFRQRFSCNGELFSSLRYGSRGTCCPEQPCASDVDYTVLASVECANSFSEEDEEIRYEVCRLPELKDAAEELFGEDYAKSVSKRKVFALLARASGAYHVGGAGSWIYKEMRDRFELSNCEESDEEEKASGWDSGF